MFHILKTPTNFDFDKKLYFNVREPDQDLAITLNFNAKITFYILGL